MWGGGCLLRLDHLGGHLGRGECGKWKKAVDSGGGGLGAIGGGNAVGEGNVCA